MTTHSNSLAITVSPSGLKPGPWRITFDTNPDDCNLHCIMCEDHSPYSTTQPDRLSAGLPKRRMDIELIRRVLADSVGTPLREIIPSTMQGLLIVRPRIPQWPPPHPTPRYPIGATTSVALGTSPSAWTIKRPCSTMGEPLLYRDFDEILDLCAQYGVKLNLTTNGTFPRRGARAWAERIVPVTSDVKVSWNGSTKETQEKVMLGTKWETVLENVGTFIAARDEHAARGGNRCRVTFQLTFMEVNYAELPEVVKLAADMGVDRVKGHHLWAHFSQIRDQSMRRSPGAIEKWNATVDAAYEAAERHWLPDGNRVLLENIFRLDAANEGEIAAGAECPFLGQEAWVASDGRFNPCCAPDALRRTLGDLGNVNHTSLYDIWQSANYRNLQSNYMEKPLCRGCNMRRPESS